MFECVECGKIPEWIQSMFLVGWKIRLDRLFCPKCAHRDAMKGGVA